VQLLERGRVIEWQRVIERQPGLSFWEQIGHIDVEGSGQLDQCGAVGVAVPVLDLAHSRHGHISSGSKLRLAPTPRLSQPANLSA
jgi:hypothetical protein